MNNNIENQLNNLANLPDPEWVSNTRARLEVYAAENSNHKQSNNIFIKFLIMQKWLLIGVGTLAVFGVVAGSAFLVINRGSSARSIQTLNLTAQEQANILTQIAKNNDSTTLRNTQNQSSTFTTETTKMAAAGDLSILPYWEPNTFRKSTSTINLGPKASSCQGLTAYSENGSSEFLSYYGTDFTNSYNKSINKDNAGNIVSLSVSESDSSSYTNYEYIGGAYAIKTVTQVGNRQSGPSAMPFDATTSNQASTNSELDLTSYFGNDVQITQKFVQNNNEYYVVRYTQASYCDISVGGDAFVSNRSEASTNKLYIEQIIDAKTFAVTESKTYINDYDANNLVITNTYEASTTTGDYNQFSNLLSFDLNVPVKSVTITDPSANIEAFAAKTYEYLSSKNIDLLAYPSSELNGLSANLVNPEVLLAQQLREDIQFYAPTEKGKQQYNQVLEYKNMSVGFNTTELGYAITTDNLTSTSYYVSVYNNPFNATQVLGGYETDPGTVVKQVSIAGTPAKIYSTTSSYTTEPYSDEMGNTVAPITTTYVSYVVVIEKGNYTYVVNANGEDLAKIESFVQGLSFLNIKADSTKQMVLKGLVNTVVAVPAIDPAVLKVM